MTISLASHTSTQRGERIEGVRVDSGVNGDEGSRTRKFDTLAQS